MCYQLLLNVNFMVNRNHFSFIIEATVAFLYFQYQSILKIGFTRQARLCSKTVGTRADKVHEQNTNKLTDQIYKIGVGIKNPRAFLIS